MPRKNRIRENRCVVYSRNMEVPDDWMHFVHFPYFTARWKEIGFDDEDLRALEVLIMAAPRRYPVVAGTGGLRKIRFARSDGNRGSSGGARIGYVHVPEYFVIAMIAVFSKDQQDNFTSTQKKAIRQGIHRFKAWLEHTEGMER